MIDLGCVKFLSERIPGSKILVDDFFFGLNVGVKTLDFGRVLLVHVIFGIGRSWFDLSMLHNHLKLIIVNKLFC